MTFLYCILCPIIGCPCFDSFLLPFFYRYYYISTIVVANEFQVKLKHLIGLRFFITILLFLLLQGYTPLHIAMQFGKDNIFELLQNVYSKYQYPKIMFKNNVIRSFATPR